MREQFIPDPKKIQQRKEWERDVVSRQNHLYLRATLIPSGSQKQRKQSKTN